jgi:S1-C subfamily serine protease
VVKADIRKGNSGGPLLDARTGAVLGCLTTTRMSG